MTDLELQMASEIVYERSYPEPNTGCWLWSEGGLYNYGVVNLNGVRYMAHRLSWLVFRGDIPPGLCVLHRCDVGECVNPSHLFLGTRTENNADKVRKGRGISGPNQPHLVPSNRTAEWCRQAREWRRMMRRYQRIFGKEEGRCRLYAEHEPFYLSCDENAGE